MKISIEFEKKKNKNKTVETSNEQTNNNGQVRYAVVVVAGACVQEHRPGRTRLLRRTLCERDDILTLPGAPPSFLRDDLPGRPV